MEHLYEKARLHIAETIEHAILLDGEALVIFDEDSELGKILTEGYRRALPEAKFMNISELTKESAIEEFHKLSPGDLVVLIQSGNFRIDDFRIRISLFQQKLKVIEHMHLFRLPEDEWGTYINSLHYDKDFYHPLGHGVRDKLLKAQRTEVRCSDTVLTYDSPFEHPKLNIGDYRGMENVGGTFPIGEVFTEAQDMSKVNGEARVYAFAGLDFLVGMYEPFKVTIKEGILSANPDEVPPAFMDILALIQKDEPVYVREFGLGMNPAITKEHGLSDVTAFERITGLHLSLGAKHSVYGKPGFRKKDGRYHIDIFVAADEILLDGETLYKDGSYIL